MGNASGRVALLGRATRMASLARVFMMSANLRTSRTQLWTNKNADRPAHAGTRVCAAQRRHSTTARANDLQNNSVSKPIHPHRMAATTRRAWRRRRHRGDQSCRRRGNLWPPIHDPPHHPTPSPLAAKVWGSQNSKRLRATPPSSRTRCRMCCVVRQRNWYGIDMQQRRPLPH